MSSRLQGLTAVVTGAGSGIGRGVAQRFVAEGAEVWFLGRHRENLAAATDGLGERAHVLVCDVTDLAAVEAAFDQVPGRLDVAVANAAVQLIGRDSRIGDVPPEVWRTTVDINLTGCFHTVRCAVRRMLRQEPRDGMRGSIIVSGSPCGITGEGAGFAAYSATKAGTHGIARTTAMDYAAEGIRVNTVIPGHTLTPLVNKIREDDRLATAIDHRIPLGRPGTVEEVTGAYVYFAGDESVYATGGMLFVDGGMTNL
ncbi:MAG: SDR family oxidoreductase [Propionibacteriaceae bacterium]|nr:SDR family oxidoreductase [Propionibacteriaceae bacterium]